MKKILKDLAIFCILAIIIAGIILPRELNNLDEIWNFNFARNIANGLMPYRDFNMVQTPLLSIICGMILKAFGTELFTMRIIAVVLCSSIMLVAYKILEKLETPTALRYAFLIATIYLYKNYFCIDYNFAVLWIILIVTLIELENIEKKNPKLNFFAGIMVGMAILTKQTTGIFLALVFLLYRVLIISNKQEIKKYSTEFEVANVGTVIQVADGIARIHGLEKAMQGELLEFPHEVYGMVMNLEEDNVGAVLLGDSANINEGDMVKTTGRVATVPVGDAMLGRVVNALGQPIDGKGPVNTDKIRPIERVASGVISRKSVDTPLQTGIKAIDSMVPIGRGQRELIIGDRQTGKTAIAIDTIINQKDQDVLCIYVAIGQKASTVANIVKTLEESGAMDYTTVVAATASELAPLQYIAPYAGCAIGEEWMESGKDVLIVYDDLTKHAAAYRTLSLLLRRPPGREAFPGDVFYLHSRLLERAAKLSDKLGGGSLTALPIIETQAGDVSAYIPTNVISITDGQIYLETEMFNSGFRPAVNPGLSVSRVGGSAQIKAMKKIAGPIRIELAQYRELAAFSQFGSDLDADTKRQLDQGERIREILKQDQYAPLPVWYQVIIIYAATKQYLLDIAVEDVLAFEKGLFRFVDEKYPEVPAAIRDEKQISEETEKKLIQAIEEYKRNFIHEK